MHLAQKYRPKKLADIVSQDHLVGERGIMSKMVASDTLTHSFFYGPAGVGKTTLARAIAKELDAPFYEKNATTLKVSEIREIIKQYSNSLLTPILFIDEVHRMSKTQQEVLLPYMEDMRCIVLGASTQNPYYSLTSAIRSRSHSFELHAIATEAMEVFLEKVLKNEKIEIDDNVKAYLIHSSSGDIRAMLHLLESANTISDTITIDTLKAIRKEPLRAGTNEDDSHYDVISAMIKSIRGSDIDASLYYLALAINAGESSDFIARRLAILASEDIGNANPNALNLAASTLTIVSQIGFPEARITLSQLVIYLASSPKSNSAYNAINKALKIAIDDRGVPEHIKTHSKAYKYPHDFGGWVKQKYLNFDIKIYESSQVGFEQTLNEWLEKIKTRLLNKS
ncbi:MAG: replication-associated recombination protein A [Campylobacterota bacterium]|nr:replication-associated recombination protein A [Campylobacterota bacterium]